MKALDSHYDRGTGGGQVKAASLAPLVERFEANEFDLVGVGRALIGDPEWVRKVHSEEARRAFSAALLADIA